MFFIHKPNNQLLYPGWLVYNKWSYHKYVKSQVTTFIHWGLVLGLATENAYFMSLSHWLLESCNHLSFHLKLFIFIFYGTFNKASVHIRRRHIEIYGQNKKGFPYLYHTFTSFSFFKEIQSNLSTSTFRGELRKVISFHFYSTEQNLIYVEQEIMWMNVGCCVSLPSLLHLIFEIKPQAQDSGKQKRKDFDNCGGSVIFQNLLLLWLE